MKIKNVIGGVFVLFQLSVSLCVGAPQIDGTYEGAMEIPEQGKINTVPLALALTLTGETTKVEVSPGVFELVKVIDGNFLVQKEGGPFAFSKVTYRLENSEIDMSYRRTQGGVSASQPPTYRLVGKVAANGSISGRVLSGFKGQIGTFILAKVENKPLINQAQYVGVWVGAIKTLPEGDLYRFSINISATGFATVNPLQFEFDYTFGKIAHMTFENTNFELRNTVIDYIHQRVIMSDAESSSSTGITVDGHVDFATGKFTGTFSSVLGGQKGEFNLTKLP